MTAQILASLAAAALALWALVCAVRSMNEAHGFRPGGGELPEIHPVRTTLAPPRPGATASADRLLVVASPGEAVLHRRDYDRVDPSALNGVYTVVHVLEHDGSLTTIDPEGRL